MFGGAPQVDFLTLWMGANFTERPAAPATCRRWRARCQPGLTIPR